MTRPASSPLRRALPLASLLLWAAAARAADQACTLDWGSCGSQSSSTSACCSPQFSCEKKGDLYWQCVQNQQPPALQLATLPPPPPLPTLAPLPSAAPEAGTLGEVRDQLEDLKGEEAKKVTKEVAKLSGLADDLSSLGEEISEAARMERASQQAGHSAADVAAESARLQKLSQELKAKVQQIENASAGFSEEAGVAAQGASRFSEEAAKVARMAEKLPGAEKAASESRVAGESEATGESGAEEKASREPEAPAGKVLLSPSAPAQQPAAAHGDEPPCPDDADLESCISWCNRASPGSQPTLAGNFCSKMGTKEFDLGMLPQCECYDSKMESVLKSCTSSCKGALNSGGGAAAAEVMQGVKTEMEPRSSLPIDVAVLYSTHCPACRNFIAHGLAQLMHAGLPGREVNVSLLPMDAGSAMARTQLCAMRQTQLRPMSVDGPSLKKGLDYLTCCDLGGGVDRATAQRCAGEAGFDWGELERCAEGPDGTEMAMAATRATSHVQDMLKTRGFQSPPGIPWVFVQGTLLRCSGTMCAHEILPPSPGQQTNGLHEGGKPLAPGGAAVGFVDYVCSRLSPQPASCQSLASQRPVTVDANAPQACENCFQDMGHALSWRRGRRALRTSAFSLTAAAAAVAACVVLLAAAMRAVLKSQGRATNGTFSLLSFPRSDAPLEDGGVTLA